MTDITCSTDTTRTGPPVTPDRLGVGMRLSVHPHCDDFVSVIVDALENARSAAGSGLRLETDEVSTYVAASGEHPEQRIVAFASDLLAAAHRRSGGGHVVAHVLLSRGCPGEASCALGEVALPVAPPVELTPTGIRATAQWSLYPLLDGGAPGGDHMAYIEAAIAQARLRGITSVPAHYATMLSGDLAEVLTTAADAWTGVGREVPHVVTHLTVSVGSLSSSEEGAA